MSRDILDGDRALGDFEARYRTLVEQIPAVVYTAEFGESGRWNFVSPQIEAILGYTPEEWMADPTLWFRQLHPEDRSRAMEEEARARENGHRLSSEYRMVARDGRTVWVRDDAAVVTDAGGRPMLMQGVIYDVSDHKRAEEELSFLAYHDRLTHLPNRAMFEELLGLAVARGRRHQTSTAVLYLDLDDFKLVNDTLGHTAGDELIQQVARRLTAATREADVVARQGGDEFLVLVADIPGEPGSKNRVDMSSATLLAEAVAGRISEALQGPFLVGEVELYVTTSVGIALFPGDGDDPESLLKHADAAMYHSKRMGPGGFQVYSVDVGGSSDRLALANSLRQAAERHQWVLHYQPVVTVEEGSLSGVEALVRWNDPRGGLVLPGEFIPLAEEMGIIVAISEWVLEEVCRQWKLWADQGLHTRISFNLSPRQLWQGNLASSILSLLDRHGIDPRWLTVEVTESVAMTDPDRTQRILQELHDRGLTIAIDDFGTGHSSLSRLKHLPVDVLKIDMSFIRDVPHDPDACTMVRAMVQLAHSLEMTPLAEGVETEAQREFLVENGCSLVQGFLFGRPMPAAEIESRYGPAARVATR